MLVNRSKTGEPGSPKKPEIKEIQVDAPKQNDEFNLDKLLNLIIPKKVSFFLTLKIGAKNIKSIPCFFFSLTSLILCADPNKVSLCNLALRTLSFLSKDGI